MSNRNKRKGRAKFILLEGYVLRTEAWRSLTPADRSLYLALKWKYDGLNNGRIGLGCREAAELMGVSSKDTANRSFDNLQDRGFIRLSKPSGFMTKNRAAAEWRLTEYPCDVTGELPTKEFTRWVAPEKTTVRNLGQTVRFLGQDVPKRRASHG